MLDHPHLLFGSTAAPSDPPELQSLVSGMGRELEDATVVVLSSRWKAFLNNLEEMGTGPVWTVLYMDTDNHEPAGSWELADVVIARGDSAGLYHALAAGPAHAPDLSTASTQHLLGYLAGSAAAEATWTAAGKDLDEQAEAELRAAAALEIALRGHRSSPTLPLGGPSSLPAEHAVAVAVLLIGWARAGFRPRPGALTRGGGNAAPPDPMDLALVLQTGATLEGEVGGVPLALSLASEAGVPALAVSTSVQDVVLQVYNGSEVIWKREVGSDSVPVPLDVLRAGDAIVLYRHAEPEPPRRPGTKAP